MRCEWIKKNGEQCKANARDGEKYCSAHLKMAEERELEANQLPSDPEVEAISEQEPVEVLAHETQESAAEENNDAMAKAPAVINKTVPRRIRFTGKGTYTIPSCGLTFYRPGQVEEVPYAIWERLHLNSDARDVFEEV